MPESVTHRAYILHARRYRDTSLLADIFTLEEGRYSVVIRGARGGKSGRQGLAQLFSPLLVSVFGRGELKTAGAIEAARAGYRLAGENLLIGMYVNELLYRVLGKYEKLPHLYTQYELLLEELGQGHFAPIQIRRFELSLLASLGYGITFDVDAESGEPIDANGQYHFIAEQGFQRTEGGINESFSGRHLISIASGEYGVACEPLLKHVVRKSLRPLLGGKPLNSRALFEGRAG